MRRKVQVGDRIQIRTGMYDDSPWMTGNVEGLLSTQFTVAVEDYRNCRRTDDRIYYAFYMSEGSDWRFK